MIIVRLLAREIGEDRYRYAAVSGLRALMRWVPSARGGKKASSPLPHPYRPA